MILHQIYNDFAPNLLRFRTKFNMILHKLLNRYFLVRNRYKICCEIVIIWCGRFGAKSLLFGAKTKLVRQKIWCEKVVKLVGKCSKIWCENMIGQTKNLERKRSKFGAKT